MSLIASDFNNIPDVKEPLVKEPRWFQPIYHIFYDDQLFVQKDGCSTDYNSYLDAKGDVDIFFQTDFVCVIGNLKITIIQGRKTKKGGYRSTIRHAARARG